MKKNSDSKKSAKVVALPELWALFSLSGRWLSTYESEEEAREDCWGPLFKDEVRLVHYIQEGKSKIIR